MEKQQFQMNHHHNTLSKKNCSSKNSSDSEQSETDSSSIIEQPLSEIFLKEISKVLNTIICEKTKSKITKTKKSPFDHDNIPKISLFNYLLRIKKYSRIENSSIIIALIYIDRICKKKKIVLTKYNIHRIILSSILISIKNNEDIIYDNLYFSKIGGVTPDELFKLEKEFLKIIDFELYVSDELYNKYYNFLNINHIAEAE